MKKIILLSLFAASLMRADEIPTFAVMAISPAGDVDYTSTPAAEYDYALPGVLVKFPNDKIDVWECAPGCQYFYTVRPYSQPPHVDPQPARTPEPNTYTTVTMCGIGLALLMANRRRKIAQ